MARWRTVRVFISSTFQDMHAERDHLVKVVFPRLRERLETRRLHLVDIDLRWGVTADQADNDMVLDLCLEEIDRSRPFFIGILGQRYGWVPETFPEPAVAEYGWIQGMTGKSITALEIHHGVLRNPRMAAHAMFYFRDDAFLESPEMADAVRDSVFLDEHSEKLASLKQEIDAYCRATDAPLRTYPCGWDPARPNPEDGTQGRIVGLEAFGQWVEGDLYAAIRREYPQVDEEPPEPARPGTLEWLPEEQDYHERFVESRLRVYVGRQSIHDELTGYIEGESTGPLLVSGGSGSGKSSILAKLWEARVPRDEQGNPLPPPDAFILSHFVGASPSSTSLQLMLWRFCLALKERFGLTRMVRVERPDGEEHEEERPYEVPEEPEKLPQVFQEMVQAVPEGQRTVILIDAVNQLDEQEQAQQMNWLPVQLAPHVKIVVSCIEEPGRDEPALDALRRRGTEEVRVPVLTDAERREIVRQLPSVSAKTLDDKQVDMLLDNPATENPLYLSVALEELRGFGGFGRRGELLEGRIAEFPRVPGEEGVTALFAQVIERLESEIGQAVVHDVLTLVASSRRGLSERELGELLTVEGRTAPDTDPIGRMQVMLRQIRPYLLRRGSLIDFYHRNLFKAVRAAYLGTPERQRDAHGQLADYFAAKPNFIRGEEPGQGARANERKGDELPTQYAKAGRDEELESLLTRFEFLQAKVDAFGPQPLIEDYDLTGAERNEPLGLIQGAIQLSANVLVKDAAQLRSQIHGRLAAQEDIAIRSLLQESLQPSTFLLRTSPWMRPITPSLIPSGGPLIRTLEGHTHRVCAVAVTADGRRAVSASNRGSTNSDRESTLRVWDLELGRCMHTLEGHTHRVYAVAVTADGRRAVSGSNDKTLKLWSLESGQCINTLEGHTDIVQAVAVTSDGRRAVSGGWNWDHTLKLWDLESGRCIRTLEGHSSGVNAVAVTPDGRRAVSVSNDKTLKLWSLESGQCINTLEGHTEYVSAVAVTSDGRRAISGSWDKTLKVWDLESGRCIHTLEGRYPVALTPDGRRAVSGSRDDTLKLWDLELGRCMHTLEGHTGHVSAVAVTSDGRRAISGSWDHTLKLWDLESGPSIHAPDRHTSAVYDVAAAPDGRRAISGSGDKTLKVWDLESGRCIRTLRGHKYQVNAVRVTPDGRRAVSASEALKLWDLESGRCLHAIVWLTTSFNAVTVTADGRCAVSDSGNKKLEVWDLESGRHMNTLQGHTSWVSAIAVVTPDGRHAVSGSRDKTLKLWDLESGRCIHTLEGHTGWVRAVAVTPDGRRAVSGAFDKRLKLWDLESGRCIHTLQGHTESVWTVAVTPEGRRAVSGAGDHTLKLWNLESGRCIHTLEGHSGRVDAVAVTPDGRRAVSGSSDDTLKLWDLESGQVLASFTGESAMLVCAMSPDGRTIVAGTLSGRVHVLRLEGLEAGPVVVTAWGGRAGHWRHAFGCPLCRVWSDVSESALGTELPCPECGKAIKLNPFTVSADWRPVADAWRG